MPAWRVLANRHVQLCKQTEIDINILCNRRKGVEFETSSNRSCTVCTCLSSIISVNVFDFRRVRSCSSSSSFFVSTTRSMMCSTRFRRDDFQLSRFFLCVEREKVAKVSINNTAHCTTILYIDINKYYILLIHIFALEISFLLWGN